MKNEAEFLSTDIRQMFSQNDAIILGVWPGMTKLPKISLLLLFNILRMKGWLRQAFLHANKHESLLQIDILILMGIVTHSQSSQKKQVYNVFTISQKRS